MPEQLPKSEIGAGSARDAPRGCVLTARAPRGSARGHPVCTGARHPSAPHIQLCLWLWLRGVSRRASWSWARAPTPGLACSRRAS